MRRMPPGYPHRRRAVHVGRPVTSHYDESVSVTRIARRGTAHRCQSSRITDLLPLGSGHHAVPPADGGRGQDRRGVRPGIPRGGPRSADPARRDGHAGHRPPAAARPPPPATGDPGRPGGLPQRPVRRPRPAQERVHRGRRRAADVPGHRHRDRDGQARPARCSPTGGDEEHICPRRLRRLHHAEPAVLPARRR